MCAVIQYSEEKFAKLKNNSDLNNFNYIFDARQASIHVPMTRRNPYELNSRWLTFQSLSSKYLNCWRVGRSR